MKKRSDRLAPVLRLYRQRERDAAQRLGEGQRVLNEERNKLNDLEQYEQEYRANFNVVGQGGMLGSHVHSYQKFVDNMKHAISQQIDVIAQVQISVDERMHAWREANVRYKSLLKVFEKYRQQELKEAERLEQRENDERPLLKKDR